VAGIVAVRALLLLVSTLLLVRASVVAVVEARATAEVLHLRAGAGAARKVCVPGVRAQITHVRGRGEVVLRERLQTRRVLVRRPVRVVAVLGARTGRVCAPKTVVACRVEGRGDGRAAV
jgi:hypothetical protein